jgi:hypothetical protein
VTRAQRHDELRAAAADTGRDVTAELPPLRFVPSPNSQEVESRCALPGISVAGSSRSPKKRFGSDGGSREYKALDSDTDVAEP